MCGIVGIYSKRPDDLTARAERSLALIENRGPDAQRLVFSGLNGDNAGRDYCGALGAARLAMVDVYGPDQPLMTADERYRIAFHGEIWNYRELRRELQSRGIRFQTAGDTEVVLYAVVKDGNRAAASFRGQFAYIVEDTLRGVVHAGRDPHGICPLYYGTNKEGDFILGSTVKVLLENKVRGGEMKVLPQGYTLTYCTTTGELEFKRYYDITAKINVGHEIPSSEELRDLVFSVIRQRIPTEVPYVTIVGGIDSSLVTAVCSKSEKPPECIITVTTTEDENSEDVRNAKLLSEILGVEARIGIVDDEYVKNNLVRAIDALGSGNYFEVVTGIVGLKAAEMAREAGAKAIITGGGSDEIFGGYDFVWNMFSLECLEKNLLHVYQQSGIFECHREDGVISAVGIEARPAYYDTMLAELLFSIPARKRILGLGTDDIREKAILKDLAKGYLPSSIIQVKKSPFYRSTSIVQLFEKVARTLISEKEAVDWKKRILDETPSWLSLMFMPGRGPVLIYKVFSQQFPGLEKLGVPVGPPDYNDPESYGRFYGAFGAPLMEGFTWFQQTPMRL